jgi:hypothetical protein
MRKSRDLAWLRQKLPSKDEARRIAVKVAKLPDLAS